MGVDLHLLAEDTASNKATNEGRHTRPPVVPGEEGVSTKEATVAGSRRRVDRGDKVKASSSRDIKTVLKVEQGIGETPVRKRRTRKKRGVDGEILKSRNDQRVR